MYGLCMMNADRTDISNTNKSTDWLNKHPVLHLKRESQAQWRTSYLSGIRGTRKQRLLQGNKQQPLGTGTGELRWGSHFTRENIKGEDGSSWGITINQKLPRSPNQEFTPAEEEGENTFTIHPARERKLQKAPEGEDTNMSGIWTNVLLCWESYHPWESAEDIPVSFHHCECSLCLETSYEKFNYLKKWYFSIKTCKTFVE